MRVTYANPLTGKAKDKLVETISNSAEIIQILTRAVLSLGSQLTGAMLSSREANFSARATLAEGLPWRSHIFSFFFFHRRV